MSDDRRSFAYENILKKQGAIHRRISKPVRWNSMEFESITKFCNYLDASQTGVRNKMKQNKLIKGHYAEFIKKDK